MEKKPIDQWIVQGKKNCKSYVFYQNKVLDLSEFMLQHPGGVKALKNYVYKDITNIIFQVYPHSKQKTLGRLMRLQVGFIPEDQSSSIRPKADKSLLHTDRPKQKKKVCFTGQNQKMQNSMNKKSQSKDRMSRSINKNKQNMKQSINKTNASKHSSKSKSKKKQFLTSIRIINQDEYKTYNEYYTQNVQKVRQRQRALTQKGRVRKQKLGSCSFINNQLDQEKPNFKVPVLAVKHMNKNY